MKNCNIYNSWEEIINWEMDTITYKLRLLYVKVLLKCRQKRYFHSGKNGLMCTKYRKVSKNHLNSHRNNVHKKETK